MLCAFINAISPNKKRDATWNDFTKQLQQPLKGKTVKGGMAKKGEGR